MTSDRLPRGVRLNNAGNIREAAGDRTLWQGERATDDDPSFEEFERPEDGIRALAIVLRNYRRKHGLCTVQSIIGRWAPASENNTAAYVRWVAHALDVAPDTPIDLLDADTMRGVVCAIIRHENGRGPLPTLSTWYDDATIDRGLRMAGYAVEKPLHRSKTLAGQAAVGAGTAGIAVVDKVAPLADLGDHAQTAGNAIMPLAEGSALLRLLCVLLIVGGIGMSVYGYLHIRRRAGEGGRPIRE